MRDIFSLLYFISVLSYWLNKIGYKLTTILACYSISIVPFLLLPINAISFIACCVFKVSYDTLFRYTFLSSYTNQPLSCTFQKLLIKPIPNHHLIRPLDILLAVNMFEFFFYPIYNPYDAYRW